jgi:hypothetical protein
MATSLIPNYYKYNSAENFIESFSSNGVNGNFYYVFAGNHLPYANSAIPTIYDNVSNTSVDVYRNMIFGKQVQTTDVSLMVARVDYESNIRYDMYDDQDTSLASKNFFVVVNDGGFYNVFKCLNNNSNANSTVSPSITSIGTDGIFYSPVDGYTWKYMYSINNTTFDKFANEKYIPYTANTDVIDNATDGAINSIKINSTGAGYSNYIQSASFVAADVHLYSNTKYYGISAASGASSTDDFYRGCIFGITSGTGAGQYRVIEAYEGTANTKYVVIEDSFDPPPDNSSTYSIYPGVYIYGDQTETVNASAWAYVNTSGNTISRVEVIEPGAGYKIAVANVYAHPSVGITSTASVRPILSPPGGHGSNPANELYSSRAAISVKFTTTEANTIPSTNQFRQIGVILNPTYSSAAINFSSSTAAFAAGENVYSFYPKRIHNHVAMSTGSISANVEYDGVLDSLLNVNDKVFISDGSQTQLFTVSTVTNNSVVEFTTTSLYDFANAQMYTLDTQAVGTVIVTSSGSITLSNIMGHIKDDAAIVGDISGAYSDSVTGITVSDISKQFDTFIGTYRYTGTVLSGTFQDNETVIQVTNTVSNAILHSVQSLSGVTSFFVTNQNGIFNTSNTITGSNSGAVATLTDKYIPEIVFGSGRIIYLENLDPITRANTQSEVFKLIFEF